MNDNPVQFLWATPLLKRSLADHESANSELVELFYAHRDA